jgi:ABC-2 type transport system permease protein
VKTLLRAAWAFLVRDFQTEVSYRLSFVLSLFGLFVSATLWYFMARFIGGVSDEAALRQKLGGLDYYSFTLVGLMVSRFLDVAQSSYGAQIRSEQTTGTLEVMLVTPTRLGHLVLAASTWSYAFALLQASAYLLFGVFVFGVKLQLGSVVGAFAAVLFSVLALSGIGILSAAFVLYFKRGNPIDFVVSMTSLLFGNLLIPVATLPPEIAWVSKWIPLTYAVGAVRGTLLQGKGLVEIAPDLVRLAAFAAVLVPIGLLGARVAVRRAKREGSLVQY